MSDTGDKDDDVDSDDEYVSVPGTQITHHKGPMHVQFFDDEKQVRVERVVSSKWELTARQGDIRSLGDKTPLFGGIFEKKKSNEKYYLARIKVGGFHPEDGTYDVEYLEDIIARGIKDQQARRISPAKIRDVPVDFRVFTFSIILSSINFVSDLYYISFASYKHDSLRWISLGLLFLPVVNFVVLDFAEFSTISFVQFFWGIATNASQTVWKAFESIKGEEVSADQVRTRLYLTTTAVTTFLEGQVEILVSVDDAAVKLLAGKMITGVGIAPGTKVVAVKDQPVETTEIAEGGAYAKSLVATKAKVRVVTLSSPAFSSGSSVTFHLVDPGVYHNSFEKTIEQHSVRYTRRFLLLPLVALWDGLVYDCFGAAHYFLKATMAILWGIDKLSTFIFNALLTFGVILNFCLAEHEDRSDDRASGKVKKISEDGWKKSRHHLVDLELDLEEENKLRGNGDAECGHGWGSITDSIASAFGAAPTEADAINSTTTAINATTATTNIKVSSRVNLKCLSGRKIVSLMNSAYLERAVFQEQSLFDILFVMAQHRRVLYDMTVFNSGHWNDATKLPPIILSTCYYVSAVVSMYMGLGLVAFLLALMKTAILLTKLASLVLYPILLVFNVFSIVMLYLGGFFLSALAYLISILSITVVTVFTIHLKLFGFPVVGEMFFARKNDSGEIKGEEMTCIDSSALVLKDIHVTAATVIDKINTASSWTCSDGEAKEKHRFKMHAPKLDPNIKALNRAIYSEMIFETVPQLVVTCLNAALTGGAQKSAFIITVLSSSATFVYNTLPYGYYIFYNDTFTSETWKNKEGLDGICSKAYYFITEEISYRINLTPRFNVADMDPVTLGDKDRDFSLYAGLIALVVSSVFLLFGVQTFYLEGPYALGCFLLAVFGVCFGVALYCFIECSDPNPKVKTPTSSPIAWMVEACNYIGLLWIASSHFLLSLAFLISTILFFMNRDGYSSVPSVLTAFAPVFIVAILFFASTLLLLINDAVEYFRDSETKFGGLKLMLFYAFTYLLWVIFAALVAYKLDFPDESSWIPWRAVAAVSFGLLITALCCHSAQYDNFLCYEWGGAMNEKAYNFLLDRKDESPAIWSSFPKCCKVFASRVVTSHLSPYASLYLVLGIPFVIGFSAFTWAADVGLTLPPYAYFLCSQVWAFFAVIGFLVAGQDVVFNDFQRFELGYSRDIRIFNLFFFLLYFCFIFWWQSMLVSFVATHAYPLVSSYSLVMIPTYLFLLIVAGNHFAEYLNILDYKELRIDDKYQNLILITIPTHRFIKNVIATEGQSLARGVIDTIAILSSTPITFPVGLVLFPQTAFHVTNHFLWMFSFSISTILFFAYLDGYSLVPTCMTAFVPMFLNLILALYSGIVVLGSALRSFVRGEPRQKNVRFCVRFFLMDVLWALFLAMVAYKLDYPLESAWLQWRGVAGLSWVILIVGWCGVFVAFDTDVERFIAYPLVRFYATWGVPFVVGFSMYAWARDVNVTFPTYAYFLMQQIWTPLTSLLEFTIIEEISIKSDMKSDPFNCCLLFPFFFGFVFSWWQSMLVVFVHGRTYSNLSSYCLALIPTFAVLLLTTFCEHLVNHLHYSAWSVYERLVRP